MTNAKQDMGTGSIKKLMVQMAVPQTILKLKVSNMKLIPSIILPCLGLGISSFIMVSTESILSVSFTSSLAEFGGDVAVSAMTVLTSINQLVTQEVWDTW